MMLALAAAPLGCSQTADEDAAESEDELRFFPVTQRGVEDARRSGDPAKIAKLLHTLASDRTVLPWNRTGTRIDRTRELLDGLGIDEVRAVRAAYIAAETEDPEITIRSDGLLQPLLRLSREDELEMVGALNAAQMSADAAALAAMAGRARGGVLSGDDRRAYFAMLPRMGLWDAPVRVAAGDRGLDAMERSLLERAWKKTGSAGSLDAALRGIESKLPAADLGARAARERSIAVIASSHGAQWQELMGWAKVIRARGYHMQVFTPEGRPVAFQRDSLSVSAKTAPLGFGCPPELDPAGTTGELAAELLANAAGAASFDASQFGAVYLAGGLGFNEDVAVAYPGTDGRGRERTVLTANENIARMMQGAIAERLPIIAICHGPTLFAATPIVVEGRTEALNAGIATASLPPFESYVGKTGRKEIQFSYDVNTHEVLAEVGGQTSVLTDIANMSRVVTARKADMDIITGPGPQAASALAEPTISALGRKWGR